jgi:hypothetical protein
MKLNSCVISLIIFLIYVDLSATTQQVDELPYMGHFLLRSFIYLVNMASYFKIAFLKKKEKEKEKEKENIIRVELTLIIFYFILECQTLNSATINIHSKESSMVSTSESTLMINS